MVGTQRTVLPRGRYSFCSKKIIGPQTLVATVGLSKEPMGAGWCQALTITAEPGPSGAPVAAFLTTSGSSWDGKGQKGLLCITSNSVPLFILPSKRKHVVLGALFSL